MIKQFLEVLGCLAISYAIYCVLVATNLISVGG